MENELLGKKKEKDNNKKDSTFKKDSNERKFCFEIGKSKAKIIEISDFKSFSKEVKKIKNPCAISNFDEILKETREFKNNDMIDIDPNKTIFDENIQIVPLTSKITIKDFFMNKETNIFPYIFSSKTVEDEGDDNINTIFKKVHSFNNGMSIECRIKDFCKDSKYHFPDNSIDTFFKIDRNLTRKYRIFYDHKMEDEPYLPCVAKYFGPKGTGKSLIIRMILSNYNEFDDYYTPYCIFNIKLLKELFDDNKAEKIKEIIFNESICLFKEVNLWELFIEKIKGIFYSDVIEFVKQIIELYLDEYKNNYPLFVLDNYSNLYDEDNVRMLLEKQCFKLKNFNLYIIYNIKCQEDQKDFIKEFNPQKPIYYEYDIDKSKPAYYLNNLKSFNELKQYLIEKNIEIPKNYEDYFGDNPYYFFLFHKNKGNQDFSVFIKEQKLNIILDLNEFYGTTIKKEQLKQIYESIKRKNIEFDLLLFESLPGNYINFTKELLPNKKFKYTIDFAFPLIKECFEAIIDEVFFIDIRDEAFMHLEPVPMGINFDIFMIDWIGKQKNIFGFKNEEIEFVKDIEILEKNKYDVTGRQMFIKKEIISVVKNTQSLLDLKKECSNKNLNNKKLIIILQKFNGKSVDFIALGFNENSKKFLLNCFQIKLSDSYKLTDDIKKRIPLEIEYIREKYAYIMNINIENQYAFFTYLGFFELKKKFIQNNIPKSIFYSKTKNSLVDEKGDVLTEFPMKEETKIYAYKPPFFYLYEVHLSLELSNPYILIEKYKKDISCKYKLKNNEAKFYIKKEKKVFKYKINDDKGTISKSVKNNIDEIIILFDIYDNSQKDKNT